jgi:hypothetical protein
MERNLGTSVDQMIATGDFDGAEDFLAKNARFMTPADRQRTLKFIRRQDIVTDFTTEAALSERAASGENIEPEAKQAVIQGLLSDADYRVIVNESRSTGWRRRGFTYIEDNMKSWRTCRRSRH